MVTRCFHAWRDHVSWKKAAARQQQPQKALSAFGLVAQQRCASALLAASFHKVRMGQGQYKWHLFEIQ